MARKSGRASAHAQRQRKRQNRTQRQYELARRIEHENYQRGQDLVQHEEDLIHRKGILANSVNEMAVTAVELAELYHMTGQNGSPGYEGDDERRQPDVVEANAALADEGQEESDEATQDPFADFDGVHLDDHEIYPAGLLSL
ncbi:hypothetical protein LTR08_006261 [Meristemomyces frigidus]|nr:hypothetical protein LTR08_006261 [Meristemomyces frigidus]